MKKEIEAIWDDVLLKLEQEHDISSAAINAWIKPLNIKEVKDDQIVLSLNSNFDARGIHFIESKMYDFYISLAIQDITGKKYEISFVLEEAKKKKAPASRTDTQLQDSNNLNPRYTFDSFVVGTNNQMAHAACIAVAEAPAEAYNPLFLYGGAGLGKTHLMHSIAHYIMENNSKLKVLYVTSEDFTNEVINAIHHNKQEELRNKYRTIDVLLIDDIQFIIGKDSTQQEFFHTFNALYNSKSQIIISSDKPPKEIETLEERLRTRFGCGLTADIQPPDYETRIAILRKRAELDHIYIDDAIFDYIASNIKSNIRELEGALNKIRVYSKLEKRPIDLDLAKIALKDLVDNDTVVKITPDLIITTVAEHFNIQPADILSKKRSHDIAYPRQICMYLCKKLTDTSFVKIGEFLGKRDHSTVIHGSEKIEKDLQKDNTLSTTLDIIIKKMNPS
ncbi:chromosomal replication initiator protein DnaA [Anaerostipes sp.]|uniref:chromosomal replication initiator protein DnaA n=1 Tax=Anaerostipes sp. TaxID=1872530 RepID=UPI0025BAFE12|nr:chromosomal replication initiator protein DnaA [Anaerostipes sp.]MBS7009044.1 chromosomal replication initiator protein DnaA [Anaerostipes sp.]